MSGIVPEDQRTEPLDSISWRAIYLGVLGTFVLWVLLLTALSRAFQ
jgi:hypothetical protein